MCHFLKELPVVPAGVIFVCLPKLEELAHEKLEEECLKVASALPRKCAVIVGVLFADFDTRVGESSFGLPEEIDSEDRALFTLLVVPKIKNITISSISINLEHLSKTQHLYQILCQDKKFVFLLSSHSERECFNKFKKVSRAHFLLQCH